MHITPFTLLFEDIWKSTRHLYFTFTVMQYFVFIVYIPNKIHWSLWLEHEKWLTENKEMFRKIKFFCKALSNSKACHTHHQ